VVRFDAYTATSPELDRSLPVSWLFRPGDTINEAKGHHGFGSRLSVKDDTGSEVGSVSWGGKHSRVMVEVKGERTPGVVEALRAAAEHRCTRVDSCADFDAPGAFAGLLDPVERITRDHDLYAQRLGDWDLHPELGRTYMVGAASSPIRARLYEKGRQPEYRHLSKPDWVRLEIQVRPAKEAKSRYSTLSPTDVWGASKWTRQLAAEVLQQHVDPHPAGTVRRLTTDEAGLRWIAKQGGNILTRAAADLGGWDVLGLTLRELVALEKARQGQ
jgi:hypothetical protein